jgi:hypothetical protein
MFKRIGLSMAIAAGLLAFAAPRQASAETHFGVYIGTAPRVYAPAPVYNYDPYVDPYYGAAPVYSYPAPVYVSPYSYGYSYGYRDRGWREHERHEMMERQRHAEHEWREHHRGWR